MKVLQISCGGLGHGGVQAVIMDICRNLHSEVQFDIVLFTDERRYYDDEFELLGGRIFRIPIINTFKKRWRIFAYVHHFLSLPYRIYNIIKNYGPYDAIHCHNYFESGLCNLGAYFANVPLRIVQSHSIANPNCDKKEKLCNFLLNPLVNIFSNVKIGSSLEACEYLFGRNGNYSIINNGINLHKFNINLYTKLKRKKHAFVHIGQYSDIKNQVFLLDVFSQICKEFPDATLDLVGFGVQETLLKKRTHELNLEDYVNFHPHDYNIPYLLAQSSYMIFPSLVEGFGIVLIEAQAMGVYCFTSTGVPKNVNLGFVEYYDLDKGVKWWADAIIKKINNTVNPSYQVVREHLDKYNVEKIIKEYRKIYFGGHDAV